MLKNGELVCEEESTCKGECQKKLPDGKIPQKCAFCRSHKEKFLKETGKI